MTHTTETGHEASFEAPVAVRVQSKATLEYFARGSGARGIPHVHENESHRHTTDDDIFQHSKDSHKATSRTDHRPIFHKGLNNYSTQKREGCGTTKQTCISNQLALEKVRSHLPVDIGSVELKDLRTRRTPNGEKLPEPLALRLLRMTGLHLLRRDPALTARMSHEVFFRLKFDFTLLEHQALQEYFTEIRETWLTNKHDPSTAKKLEWLDHLTSRFEAALAGQGAKEKGRGAEWYCDGYGYPKEAVFFPVEVYRANSRGCGYKKNAVYFPAKLRRSNRLSTVTPVHAAQRSKRYPEFVLR